MLIMCENFEKFSQQNLGDSFNSLLEKMKLQLQVPITIMPRSVFLNWCYAELQRVPCVFEKLNL